MNDDWMNAKFNATSSTEMCGGWTKWGGLLLKRGRGPGPGGPEPDQPRICITCDCSKLSTEYWVSRGARPACVALYCLTAFFGHLERIKSQNWPKIGYSTTERKIYTSYRYLFNCNFRIKWWINVPWPLQRLPCLFSLVHCWTRSVRWEELFKRLREHTAVACWIHPQCRRHPSCLPRAYHPLTSQPRGRHHQDVLGPFVSHPNLWCYGSLNELSSGGIDPPATANSSNSSSSSRTPRCCAVSGFFSSDPWGVFSVVFEVDATEDIIRCVKESRPRELTRPSNPVGRWESVVLPQAKLEAKVTLHRYVIRKSYVYLDTWWLIRVKVDLCDDGGTSYPLCLTMTYGRSLGDEAEASERHLSFATTLR